MDFNKAVRLTFYAMVGRDDLRVPILRDIVGGASRQIMLIRVDGTLENPETTKEVFPGINQAFQQFQTELRRTTASGPLLPPADQWIPGIISKPTTRR